MELCIDFQASSIYTCVQILRDCTRAVFGRSGAVSRRAGVSARKIFDNLKCLKIAQGLAWGRPGGRLSAPATDRARRGDSRRMGGRGSAAAAVAAPSAGHSPRRSAVATAVDPDTAVADGSGLSEECMGWVFHPTKRPRYSRRSGHRRRRWLRVQRGNALGWEFCFAVQFLSSYCRAQNRPLEQNRGAQKGVSRA